MSDLRKAAEMALEALVSSTGELRIHLASPTDAQLEKNYAAIEILRQALSQPEQEPVAIVNEGMGGIEWLSSPLPDDTPLYTAPPKRERSEQREWVGLTDEEMHFCAQAMDAEPLAEGWSELIKFAKAIEAKLKEKNT